MTRTKLSARAPTATRRVVRGERGRVCSPGHEMRRVGRGLGRDGLFGSILSLPGGGARPMIHGKQV
jgi:hypothetical protein